VSDTWTGISAGQHAVLPHTGPLGKIGYWEDQSGQGAIAATEVDANNLKNMVATVGASRLIKITYYIYAFTGTSGNKFMIRLYQDGGQIAQREVTVAASGSSDGAPLIWVGTPPVAGDHTYKITYQRTSGSNNGFAAAGPIRSGVPPEPTTVSVSPQFVLVEDIGAA
jgi:hypothetical protein